VDRLRGLGNGQVPAVAALAFQTLHARLKSDFPNSVPSVGRAPSASV
jgi:hypothetical protein